MKGLTKALKVRETLTEAYEVRAFRDEDEAITVLEPVVLRFPMQRRAIS